MKTFHFSHTIEYEVEAEDEEDAIYQLADLIQRDWPDYIDNGNITVPGGNNKCSTKNIAHTNSAR